MDKRHTILLIIVGAICVVCIVVSLVFFTDDNGIKSNENPILDSDRNIKTVDNRSSFLIVYNNISNLLLNYYSNKYNVVYNILGNDYIVENGITQNNIKDKLSFLNKNYLFHLNMMYVSEGNYSSIFYINGITYGDTNQTELYIKCILDYNNLTYSITFIDKDEYNDIIKNNIIPNEENVSSNENNSFYISTNDVLSYCAYYLSDYKYYIQYDRDTAYNKLSSSMKSSFNDYSDFSSYIDENIDRINSSYISGYKLVNDNHKNNYICTDNNGYVYEFYEYSISVYSLTFSKDKKEE